MLASPDATDVETPWLEQPLQQLMDELPLGVVNLDRRGVVRHTNTSASMLIEGSAGATLRTAFGAMCERVQEGEPMVESVLSLGQVGEVRVLVSRAPCVDGYVAVLERDSTARARAEIQVMRSLLSAATEAVDPAVAAHRALATLSATLVGSSLALYEHDQRTQQLACLAHVNVAPPHAQLVGPRSSSDRLSLVGRVFATGQPLHVADLSRAFFPFERGLSGADKMSAMALPVQNKGETVGVLYVWGPRSSLSAGEVRLVLGLADALGSLVRHARADTRLKQQQVALETLMAHLPDAVLERGPQGQVTQAGGRCEAIFALPAAALREQPLARFFNSADQAQFDALVERCRAGQSPDVAKLQVSAADGQLRRCEVSVWVTHDEGGEVVRAIFRDITERERLEQQVQQARAMAIHHDRLALIGQLAAGVAHEINNPLAYVKANLALFGGMQRTLNDKLAKARQLAADPAADAEIVELTRELEEMSDDSLKGVNRIAAIVASLKGMSRTHSDELRSLDPTEAVMQAVTFFVGARHCANRVDARLSNLPEAICEVGGLSQVVLNLLDNAFDAMGPQGHITVSAEVHGAWLHLKVADQGPGIPEAVQQRVFEPFFTTKPVGKGTGLGLHISYQIIEQFGGHLRFQTGPAGTTFVIELAIPPESKEREAHG